MRKVLIFAVLIAICSTSSYADWGGVIAPYSEAAGTTCWWLPTAGLCYTYIIHAGVVVANASQWKLYVDPGFTATYVVYNTSPYLSILSGGGGFPLDPRGGISIAYGNPACEPLPAIICTITWLCSGTEQQCSGVHVNPDPLASISGVEVRDCNNNAVPANGGSLWVDEYDGAGGCPFGHFCGVVPATERTWGNIKSLYRED